MIDNGLVDRPDKSLLSLLIDDRGGDAVDAVLAAIAAAHLPRPRRATRDRVEGIEGRVYFRAAETARRR